ncbi:MAG: sulfatase-like hydrolase/transferase [Lachnospiraceae bacterium]|nr:sulfatase-like hydrolase/transferase [Lachnospiraceae bacterium]
MLCTIFKSEKLNNWFAAVLLEATSVVFMIIHFVGLEFNIYIGPQSVIGGANGVATEAGDYIMAIVVGNWPTILLFQVPIIIYVLCLAIFKLPSFKRFKGLGYIQLLIITAIFECAAGIPLCNMSPSWELLTSEFNFDTAVKYFDLQTATKLDSIYSICGNPFKTSYIIEQEPPVLEHPKEYNVMDIDFDRLVDECTDPDIKKIHDYVHSLTPSKKNEYTGIFKGKNLIQLTAESFTPYLLDEDLMPVLYRLVNNGFVFFYFYQTLWNGSTTTGEFQIMTSMLPSNGFYSMMKTVGNNMYLTLGNQFLRKGYMSIAYHNGTHTYFNRNLTHCNLGYSKFVANGTGMTGLSGTRAWPQSDLEMMEYAIPRFISHSPFNIYFMTLSGHSKYDSTNFIVNKNIEEVKAWAEEKGYDFTNTVLSYYAANLEYEKAMEYLLECLEEEGILENTVIVMTGDHYPYSLSDDYVIDETGHVDYFDVETNLINLFGFQPENGPDYSHNSLVIWTPEMEGENSVVVTDPVYSVDILPTVSNLFGFDFDSRLLVGRDVLAPETEPLVIFSDYSWLTDLGYYDATEKQFIPADQLTTTKEATGKNRYIDHPGCKVITHPSLENGGYATLDEYIKHMNNNVKNKMILSQNIPLSDYYGIIWGKIEKPEVNPGPR